MADATWTCAIYKDPHPAYCFVPQICEHKHCAPCVEKHYRNAQGEKPYIAPFCCGRDFDWYEVKAFLKAAFVKQYEKVKEELESTNPLYCSNRDCSIFLGVDDVEETVATCPECEKETCTLCRHTEHEGPCKKDSAEIETLKLAKTEGWKQCPGCKTVIDRIDGCEEMM